MSSANASPGTTEVASSLSGDTEQPLKEAPQLDTNHAFPCHTSSANPNPSSTAMASPNTSCDIQSTATFSSLRLNDTNDSSKPTTAFLDEDYLKESQDLEGDLAQSVTVSIPCGQEERLCTESATSMELMDQLMRSPSVAEEQQDETVFPSPDENEDTSQNVGMTSPPEPPPPPVSEEITTQAVVQEITHPPIPDADVSHKEEQSDTTSTVVQGADTNNEAALEVTKTQGTDDVPESRSAEEEEKPSVLETGMPSTEPDSAASPSTLSESEKEDLMSKLSEAALKGDNQTVMELCERLRSSNSSPSSSLAAQSIPDVSVSSSLAPQSIPGVTVSSSLAPDTAVTTSVSQPQLITSQAQSISQATPSTAPTLPTPAMSMPVAPGPLPVPYQQMVYQQQPFFHPQQHFAPMTTTVSSEASGSLPPGGFQQLLSQDLSPSDMANSSCGSSAPQVRSMPMTSFPTPMGPQVAFPMSMPPGMSMAGGGGVSMPIPAPTSYILPGQTGQPGHQPQIMTAYGQQTSQFQSMSNTSTIMSMGQPISTSITTSSSGMTTAPGQQQFIPQQPFQIMPSYRPMFVTLPPGYKPGDPAPQMVQMMHPPGHFPHGFVPRPGQPQQMMAAPHQFIPTTSGVMPTMAQMPHPMHLQPPAHSTSQSSSPITSSPQTSTLVPLAPIQQQPQQIAQQQLSQHQQAQVVTASNSSVTATFLGKKMRAIAPKPIRPLAPRPSDTVAVEMVNLTPGMESGPTSKKRSPVASSKSKKKKEPIKPTQSSQIQMQSNIAPGIPMQMMQFPIQQQPHLMSKPGTFAQPAYHIGQPPHSHVIGSYPAGAYMNHPMSMAPPGTPVSMSYPMAGPMTSTPMSSDIITMQQQQFQSQVDTSASQESQMPTYEEAHVVNLTSTEDDILALAWQNINSDGEGGFVFDPSAFDGSNGEVGAFGFNQEDPLDSFLRSVDKSEDFEDLLSQSDATVVAGDQSQQSTPSKKGKKRTCGNKKTQQVQGAEVDLESGEPLAKKPVRKRAPPKKKPTKQEGIVSEVQPIAKTESLLDSIIQTVVHNPDDVSHLNQQPETDVSLANPLSGDINPSAVITEPTTVCSQSSDSVVPHVSYSQHNIPDDLQENITSLLGETELAHDDQRLPANHLSQQDHHHFQQIENMTQDEFLKELTDQSCDQLIDQLTKEDSEDPNASYPGHNLIDELIKEDEGDNTTNLRQLQTKEADTGNGEAVDHLLDELEQEEPSETQLLAELTGDDGQETEQDATGGLHSEYQEEDENHFLEGLETSTQPAEDNDDNLLEQLMKVAQATESEDHNGIDLMATTDEHRVKSISNVQDKEEEDLANKSLLSRSCADFLDHFSIKIADFDGDDADDNPKDVMNNDLVSPVIASMPEEEDKIVSPRCSVNILPHSNGSIEQCRADEGDVSTGPITHLELDESNCAVSEKNDCASEVIPEHTETSAQDTSITSSDIETLPPQDISMYDSTADPHSIEEMEQFIMGQTFKSKHNTVTASPETEPTLAPPILDSPNVSLLDSSSTEAANQDLVASNVVKLDGIDEHEEVNSELDTKETTNSNEESSRHEECSEMQISVSLNKSDETVDENLNADIQPDEEDEFQVPLFPIQPVDPLQLICDEESMSLSPIKTTTNTGRKNAWDSLDRVLKSCQRRTSDATGGMDDSLSSSNITSNSSNSKLGVAELSGQTSQLLDSSRLADEAPELEEEMPDFCDSRLMNEKLDVESDCVSSPRSTPKNKYSLSKSEIFSKEPEEIDQECFAEDKSLQKEVSIESCRSRRSTKGSRKKRLTNVVNDTESHNSKGINHVATNVWHNGPVEVNCIEEEISPSRRSHRSSKSSQKKQLTDEVFNNDDAEISTPTIVSNPDKIEENDVILNGPQIMSKTKTKGSKSKKSSKGSKKKQSQQQQETDLGEETTSLSVNTDLVTGPIEIIDLSPEKMPLEQEISSKGLRSLRSAKRSLSFTDESSCTNKIEHEHINEPDSLIEIDRENIHELESTNEIKSNQTDETVCQNEIDASHVENCTVLKEDLNIGMEQDIVSNRRGPKGSRKKRKGAGRRKGAKVQNLADALPQTQLMPDLENEDDECQPPRLEMSVSPSSHNQLTLCPLSVVVDRCHSPSSSPASPTSKSPETAHTPDKTSDTPLDQVVSSTTIKSQHENLFLSAAAYTSPLFLKSTNLSFSGILPASQKFPTFGNVPAVSTLTPSPITPITPTVEGLFSAPKDTNKTPSFARFADTLPTFGDMKTTSETIQKIESPSPAAIVSNTSSGWYNHKGSLLNSPNKALFSDAQRLLMEEKTKEESRMKRFKEAALRRSQKKKKRGVTVIKTPVTGKRGRGRPCKTKKKEQPIIEINSENETENMDENKTDSVMELSVEPELCKDKTNDESDNSDVDVGVDSVSIPELADTCQQDNHESPIESLFPASEPPPVSPQCVPDNVPASPCVEVCPEYNKSEDNQETVPVEVEVAPILLNESAEESVPVQEAPETTPPVLNEDNGDDSRPSSPLFPPELAQETACLLVDDCQQNENLPSLIIPPLRIKKSKLRSKRRDKKNREKRAHKHKEKGNDDQSENITEPVPHVPEEVTQLQQTDPPELPLEVVSDVAPSHTPILVDVVPPAESTTETCQNEVSNRPPLVSPIRVSKHLLMSSGFQKSPIASRTPALRPQSVSHRLLTKKTRVSAGMATKKIFSTSREDRRSNNAQMTGYLNFGKPGPGRRKLVNNIPGVNAIDEPSFSPTKITSTVSAVHMNIVQPTILHTQHSHPPSNMLPTMKRKRGRPPKNRPPLGVALPLPNQTPSTAGHLPYLNHQEHRQEEEVQPIVEAGLTQPPLKMRFKLSGQANGYEVQTSTCYPPPANRCNSQTSSHAPDNEDSSMSPQTHQPPSPIPQEIPTRTPPPRVEYLEAGEAEVFMDENQVQVERKKNRFRRHRTSKRREDGGGNRSGDGEDSGSVSGSRHHHKKRHRHHNMPGGESMDHDHQRHHQMTLYGQQPSTSPPKKRRYPDEEGGYQPQIEDDGEDDLSHLGVKEYHHGGGEGMPELALRMEQTESLNLYSNGPHSVQAPPTPGTPVHPGHQYTPAYSNPNSTPRQHLQNPASPLHPSTNPLLSPHAAPHHHMPGHQTHSQVSPGNVGPNKTTGWTATAGCVFGGAKTTPQSSCRDTESDLVPFTGSDLVSPGSQGGLPSSSSGLGDTNSTTTTPEKAARNYTGAPAHHHQYYHHQHSRNASPIKQPHSVGSMSAAVPSPHSNPSSVPPVSSHHPHQYSAYQTPDPTKSLEPQLPDMSIEDNLPDVRQDVPRQHQRSTRHQQQYQAESMDPKTSRNSSASSSATVTSTSTRSQSTTPTTHALSSYSAYSHLYPGMDPSAPPSSHVPSDPSASSTGTFNLANMYAAAAAQQQHQQMAAQHHSQISMEAYRELASSIYQQTAAYANSAFSYSRAAAAAAYQSGASSNPWDLYSRSGYPDYTAEMLAAHHLFPGNFASSATPGPGGTSAGRSNTNSPMLSHHQPLPAHQNSAAFTPAQYHQSAHSSHSAGNSGTPGFPMHNYP